jgi:hypothetical protein
MIFGYKSANGKLLAGYPVKVKNFSVVYPKMAGMETQLVTGMRGPEVRQD